MKVVVPFLVLLVTLSTLPVQALPPSGKSVGNFPVRDPDTDSPLFVVYEMLKAGVETDTGAGLKTYRSLCLPDRKSDPDSMKELEEKEWANLREQGSSYLIHDVHGFKIWVQEMTPGPAYVTKDTKKVYVTLKNQLEPEQRRGLFIVERDRKGEWRLRSVNL